MPDLKMSNEWQDVAALSGMTGGGDLFIQPKGNRCIVQFGATAPPADTQSVKSIDGVSVESYEKLRIEGEANIWVRTMAKGQTCRLHIAEFV